MMLSRGNLSIPGEMLFEYFAILHSSYINHAPSRNTAAASPADLPAKQPDNSILDAVIVRFNDAFVVLVYEPDQLLVFNCISQ